MELDFWVAEILPRLSLTSLISLSRVSHFHREAVEKARFENPLLIRRRRLEQPVALDRIHWVSSGPDEFVLIFVQKAAHLSGDLSIVYTKDQWKTVRESRFDTHLLEKVLFNNQYGPSNGEAWFHETWTMSIGSSYSDSRPKSWVHCLLLPLREIEWFAIKLQSRQGGASYWDNNQGWNYSIEYEIEKKRIPLYRSPNPQYMYHFERYDYDEIEGDLNGPMKEYGSNIYLPMLDDWKENVLKLPFAR